MNKIIPGFPHWKFPINDHREAECAMHIRTQLNSTGLRKSARIRMMEEGGESAAPKPTLMQRWSKIAGVVALYW